jgi:hypothetical protein
LAALMIRMQVIASRRGSNEPCIKSGVFMFPNDAGAGITRSTFWQNGAGYRQRTPGVERRL